jgi:hypothetical protein
MHPRIVTARPLAIFEAIERFQIAHAYMTNSMSARLVKEAANGSQVLSSLKMAGLGGETGVAMRFNALLRQHGGAIYCATDRLKRDLRSPR